MGNPLTLIKGLGLGAGLMYLFDPEMGRRRRTRLGDQATRLAHDLGDAIPVGLRDLGHRVQGVVAESSSLLRADHASDRVVAERVRAKLGRVVSHPRPVEVAVRDGYVTLSGPILAPELDRLLWAVASVRGVVGVENRLEVHDGPGHHPSLQGGVTRAGERPELFQQSWSPATRLLLGAAGGVLLLRLLGREGRAAVTLGLVGAGLAAGGLAADHRRGDRGPRRRAAGGSQADEHLPMLRAETGQP
jgi:hypothetical protein